MDDQELLSRALSFNAGPPVHVNGRIIESDNLPHALCFLIIASRGKTWVISDGAVVLNRDGEWEHEPMSSHRTEDFKKRTRFATAREAFAFLETWRPQELERAKALGFIPWRKA